ncbi:MAG: hypothetical protein RLZZ73_149, partial [Actinomycetota bacterium]
SERETPGPIPNPEVKPLSVDGTARVTLWESRTLPDFFYKKGHFHECPFFISRKLHSSTQRRYSLKLK